MRGRRVAVLVFIFALTFSQQAIGQFSAATLETQNPEIRKPVKITITSKGLLDKIIPNQKIRIQVFLEDRILEQTELESSTDGKIGFAFVPKTYGMYKINSENVTYEKPISLNPVTIFVQKNESIFDVILRRFF